MAGMWVPHYLPGTDPSNLFCESPRVDLAHATLSVARARSRLLLQILTTEMGHPPEILKSRLPDILFRAQKNLDTLVAALPLSVEWKEPNLHHDVQAAV